MNKVILVGRLTKEPEISYSQSESPVAVARFTLAVDRSFTKKGGNDQATDFISCVAFGKKADFVQYYLHKGTKIILEGRIQTGSYKNKEGKTVYTTDIVAENIEFAESKNNAAQDDYPFN